MVEAYYPSTNQLIQRAQTRRTLILLALLVTVGLCAAVAGIAVYFTRMSGPVAGLMAFVTCVALMVPVLIAYKPQAGVYILTASALLFAGLPGNTVASAPTSLVPFWWDVSTIGQSYGNTTAANVVVFSPAEMIMIITTVVWIVRGIARREFVLRGGPILPWVLPYIGMVTFGYANGWAHGGDKVIGLWEVRAQFQFLLVFVLAANLLRTPKQVKGLLWTIAICSVIQAVMGVISYASLGYDLDHDALHGFGHEDSLFFNYILLIVILGALGAGDRKLTLFATISLPVVLYTIAVNHRRAGIGALVLAVIPLVPLAWNLYPHHRPRIFAGAVALVLGSAVYLPLAWNSDAGWAFAARAIRSVSDPNGRDAQSNAYRDIEDADLKFTRDLQPWTGMGYGRPFAKRIPLPSINFPLRDFLPHNTLLWVWMRIGHFGFFALMMLFAAALIYGPQILKEVRSPSLRLFGIIATLNMLMLFVYGKYDLQFVSSRTMVLSAIMLGVLSVLPRIQANGAAEQGEGAVLDAESGESRTSPSREPVLIPQ